METELILLVPGYCFNYFRQAVIGLMSESWLCREGMIFFFVRFGRGTAFILSLDYTTKSMYKWCLLRNRVFWFRVILLGLTPVWVIQHKLWMIIRQVVWVEWWVILDARIYVVEGLTWESLILKRQRVIFLLKIDIVLTIVRSKATSSNIIVLISQLAQFIGAFLRVSVSCDSIVWFLRLLPRQIFSSL